MSTHRTAYSEPPPGMTFGQWLTHELNRRGYDLSQRGGGRRKFADEAEIPVATVSRFLRDEGGVDPRTLGRVATGLGVPVAPLLVKAGLLPASELNPETREITPQEALAALGINDPHDQDALMGMVRALRAKEGGERAP
ncbi:helix-turn-helix domain-containing protein [Streptomyces sp. NPDC002917]|uniref:helix-turn-helix domain-containing protein n=1 Tax=Streptomyces sp. NPDC002917 TaxID=3364671 RepID=UPI0036AC126C